MAIIQFDENILKQIVSDTIKEYDRQQREKSKVKRDKRLRNTDLLLKNYRNLLAHLNYAIDDEKQLKDSDCDLELQQIQDEIDMLEENYEEVYIQAIKRTKTRTKIILKHIEVAVEFYKEKMSLSNDPNCKRRYEVISKYYFENKKIFDISEELNCSDKTISRDKKRAIEELSILFFGIDGIKFSL